MAEAALFTADLATVSAEVLARAEFLTSTCWTEATTPPVVDGWLFNSDISAKTIRVDRCPAGPCATTWTLTAIRDERARRRGLAVPEAAAATSDALTIADVPTDVLRASAAQRRAFAGRVEAPPAATTAYPGPWGAGSGGVVDRDRNRLLNISDIELERELERRGLLNRPAPAVDAFEAPIALADLSAEALRWMARHRAAFDGDTIACPKGPEVCATGWTTHGFEATGVHRYDVTRDRVSNVGLAVPDDELRAELTRRGLLPAPTPSPLAAVPELALRRALWCATPSAQSGPMPADLDGVAVAQATGYEVGGWDNIAIIYPKGEPSHQTKYTLAELTAERDRRAREAPAQTPAAPPPWTLAELPLCVVRFAEWMSNGVPVSAGPPPSDARAPDALAAGWYVDIEEALGRVARIRRLDEPSTAARAVPHADLVAELARREAATTAGGALGVSLVTPQALAAAVQKLASAEAPRVFVGGTELKGVKSVTYTPSPDARPVTTTVQPATAGGGDVAKASTKAFELGDVNRKALAWAAWSRAGYPSPRPAEIGDADGWHARRLGNGWFEFRRPSDDTARAFAPCDVLAEIERRKDKTMSDGDGLGLLATAGAELSAIGIRIARKQYTTNTTELVTALLVQAFGPADEASTRARVAAFLSTEMGAAALQLLGSVLLTLAGDAESDAGLARFAAALATELRHESLATGGHRVIEAVRQPLVDAVAAYGRALTASRAAAQAATGVRVAPAPEPTADDATVVAMPAARGAAGR